MKVIHCRADGDYDAMTFESNFEINVDLWNRIKSGEKIKHPEEDYDFDLIAMEFKDVDEEFVKFIKNEVVDYDHYKHTNFYVV